MTVPAEILAEIERAVLTEQLGPGARSIVRATDPPSMTVDVVTEQIHVAPADPVLGRIDVVSITTEAGEVLARITTGTPAVAPAQPPVPAGWLPVAIVHVHACACAITQYDVEEWHP